MKSIHRVADKILRVKVDWKVLRTELSSPFSGYLYASHEGPGFSHLRGSHHHSSQPWSSHCKSTTPSILTSSVLSFQRPSLNCITSYSLLLYHFLVTNLIYLLVLVLDSAGSKICVYYTTRFNGVNVIFNSLLVPLLLPLLLFSLPPS